MSECYCAALIQRRPIPEKVIIFRCGNCNTSYTLYPNGDITFETVSSGIVAQSPAPDLIVKSELEWLLNEHWMATDSRECGTQTGYDWLLHELQILIDKEAKARILAATKVIR